MAAGEFLQESGPLKRRLRRPSPMSGIGGKVQLLETDLACQFSTNGDSADSTNWAKCGNARG